MVATACVVSVTVAIRGGDDTPRATAGEKRTANQANEPRRADGSFSKYVEKDGKIRLPSGYRQTWAHLGSWAVAKKPGESIHEMHNVYTQRENIAAYKKTGEFPDGAVLVKEVRNTKADRLTTGHSS